LQAARDRNRDDSSGSTTIVASTRAFTRAGWHTDRSFTATPLIGDARSTSLDDRSGPDDAHPIGMHDLRRSPAEDQNGGL
jgi:hypothetical protein